MIREVLGGVSKAWPSVLEVVGTRIHDEFSLKIIVYITHDLSYV